MSVKTYKSIQTFNKVYDVYPDPYEIKITRGTTDESIKKKINDFLLSKTTTMDVSIWSDQPGKTITRNVIDLRKQTGKNCFAIFKMSDADESDDDSGSDSDDDDSGSDSDDSSDDDESDDDESDDDESSDEEESVAGSIGEYINDYVYIDFFVYTQKTENNAFFNELFSESNKASSTKKVVPNKASMNKASMNKASTKKVVPKIATRQFATLSKKFAAKRA